MADYKRVFLDGYSYFITVVTHQRNSILIDNIDLLRQSFAISKAKYAYSIDAITILPDHFHTIITPKNANDYPKIIRAIKYHFSQHLDPKYYAHIEQSRSRNRRGNKPIWQKRFYEHTIRNEKDWYLQMDYIKHNAVKHGLVENAKDWKYSSFNQ